MSEGWDGTFTPAQEAFDRQVRANDAALFAALDAKACQEWGDAGVEVQEVCPTCGHYGLHHLDDGCHACADTAREAG